MIAASVSELEDQLLNRYGSIPLGSRQTWMSIQKSDNECRTVLNLKMNGEAPRKKGSSAIINKNFKQATGCPTKHGAFLFLELHILKRFNFWK